MHRTRKAVVQESLDPFRNRMPGKSASVITGGMPLTLVVHGACKDRVATLPDMGIYHVLAAGTVFWLLASAGDTDSHLPVVLTATLTAVALLLSRMVRRGSTKH
jgi:hypothetical protein